MSSIFRVLIEETLSKEFHVVAATEDKAWTYIRDKYTEAADGFVLDYSHLAGADVIALGVIEDPSGIDNDELHHAS